LIHIPKQDSGKDLIGIYKHRRDPAMAALLGIYRFGNGVLLIYKGTSDDQ
jgi:hypothetical protein